MGLTDYRALSFDCYGTLIDWESGIIAALQPLTMRMGRGLGRDEILQAHARHESEQQRQTPTRLYSQILATVYRRLAEQWDVAVNVDDCEAYGRSVGDWPAFPDSADALKYLKQFYKLIILSNVDHRSFAPSASRLGVAFDAVYTAEDIGAYKPSDACFDYMLGHIGDLGLAPGEVLHTAESLFHDHGPANRHGLASCWIHRRHAQEGFGATMTPAETPRYDYRFTSMAELVRAHQAALTGSAL